MSDDTISNLLMGESFPTLNTQLSPMNPTTALRLAAICGFLGVALGAAGAHALAPALIANNHVEDWHTAVLYHLVHAAVLVAISRGERVPRLAWGLLTSGIVLFSGALYALALTNVIAFAHVAPFGGLALLSGWVALAFSRR